MLKLAKWEMYVHNLVNKLFAYTILGEFFSSLLDSIYLKEIFLSFAPAFIFSLLKVTAFIAIPARLGLKAAQ